MLKVLPLKWPIKILASLVTFTSYSPVFFDLFPSTAEAVRFSPNLAGLRKSILAFIAKLAFISTVARVSHGSIG